MFLAKDRNFIGIMLAATMGLWSCTQNTGSSSAAAQQGQVERVMVEVSEHSYKPDTISARAGVPLTLVFKRISESGCGEELVFPQHDIRRDLPLNVEVVVTITPVKDETITFTCGMGMYKGAVVVVS